MLGGLADMLRYGGIVLVIIGGAMFTITLFRDPTTEPMCNDQVMKPGDVCTIISRGGSTEHETYTERKEHQQDRRGFYLGPIVLAAGAGSIFGAARIDRVVDRRTGACQTANPPPPLPPHPPLPPELRHS
ncbi:hypothetical protein [Nocardia sp. NPDC004604]|uniref:hypothetical protein n=1 Tax=Nocardia sp. NPDC004604 TaxID=3157013 RepID=UPI0033B24D58